MDSQYELNTRSKASISYSSEKSSYLLSSAENNFDSYSNYFIGIGYQLRSLSNTNLFKNNYSIALSSKLGKRKNEISDQTQVQLEVLASLNIQTNKKSYIYIKAASKLLNSENYLVNELYRIGGANSIRGVNEQSVFQKCINLVLHILRLIFVITHQ